MVREEPLPLSSVQLEWESTRHLPKTKEEAMKTPNGFIFYQGPSQLDTKPIVGIAVGLHVKSHNQKTGGMIQTYILRSDVSPSEAAKYGSDVSICGTCPHKQTENGTCYVNLAQGPTAVWKAYQAGKYPLQLEDSVVFPIGRSVRLGTYGDPAAIPFFVWRRLLKYSFGITGYTHQWKNYNAHHYKEFCMASCDSIEETKQAQAMGWRTFTIVPKVSPHIAMSGNFLCPASEEAGKKLTCEDCLACGGLSSPNKASVFIPVHGVKFKQERFNSLIQIGRSKPMPELIEETERNYGHER